jgi:MerR, DNA binding
MHLGTRATNFHQLRDTTSHPEQPCAAVTRVAQAHLKDVERRISRLLALKAELERMIAQCRGNRVAECRIIETLADESERHFIGHNQ